MISLATRQGTTPLLAVISLAKRQDTTPLLLGKAGSQQRITRDSNETYLVHAFRFKCVRAGKFLKNWKSLTLSVKITNSERILPDKVRLTKQRGAARRTQVKATDGFSHNSPQSIRAWSQTVYEGEEGMSAFIFFCFKRNLLNGTKYMNHKDMLTTKAQTLEQILNKYLLQHMLN